MAHDVSDTAFRLWREWRPRTRSLHKHCIHHSSVGKRLLIQNFNLSAAQAEVPRNNRLVLRHASCRGKKPLLQALRSGHFLIQIAQKLAVQRSRMTEIDAHPLRSRTPVPAVDAERFFRSLRLQFVCERVVVAPVAVVKKTS